MHSNNNFFITVKKILKGLYVERDLRWLDKLEDSDIQPFVIQRFLVMNDYIRAKVRWLDKYVFSLQHNPKMYLSLAWTILPKYRKTPYFKYIKKKDDVDRYDFILKKVRKHFDMADNDFKKMRNRIVKAIENDKVSWFSYYGVNKGVWNAHRVDFDKIKSFGKHKIKKTKTLLDF